VRLTFSKQWAVLAGCLLVALICSPVSAQGRSQGKGHSGGGSDTSVSAAVVFRDSDRVTFHDYFVTHQITAKPLPPGIAKNVARGKPLPPGIAKRALPAELIAIGPKVDKDVSFAIVGDIVVATRGGVVIDILGGVFK